MTAQSEVGISPVLLQAITQLADPNAGPEKLPQVKAFCDENGQQKIVFCRPDGPVILKPEQKLNAMDGNRGHAETIIMTTETVDGTGDAMDKSGHMIKTEHLIDETGGELVVEEGLRHVMGQPVHVGGQNPVGNFVVVSRETETGFKDGQYVVVQSTSDLQERVLAATGDGRFTLAPSHDIRRQTVMESRLDENDQKIYIRVPPGVPRNIHEQLEEIPATISSEMSMGSVLSETGFRDGQYVVVQSTSDLQERVISATGDGRFALAPPHDIRRHAVTESRVDDNEQKIYIRVPPGVPRNIHEQPEEIPATTSSEMSMGSVLSAIASHHARLNQDSVLASTSVEAAASLSEDGDSNSQQIIIYTQEVPVAASDIAVANAEVIISDSGQGDGPIPAKRPCVEGQHLILINDSAEAVNCIQGDVVPHSEKGGTSPWTNYVQQFLAKGPCPICGDKVSGKY
jgi:hypothetical protein